MHKTKSKQLKLLKDTKRAHKRRTDAFGILGRGKPFEEEKDNHKELC